LAANEEISAHQKYNQISLDHLPRVLLYVVLIAAVSRANQAVKK
jgi:hypothetical protein